ncbi:MAG: carboxypeptidase regulatory-like domain-containing protein, partial [Acidobacteriia bacterium]|nr:carboxypeptidase regulatory-like domain-containing protein [Terriglobia bacterium]
MSHVNRLYLGLFLVLVPALLGQDPRGTMIGRVTDSTGAVVPAVALKATNSATGVSASAQTNEAGRYTLPYLLPGNYAVSAELTGFKRFVQEGVQIRVGET